MGMGQCRGVRWIGMGWSKAVGVGAGVLDTPQVCVCVGVDVFG